MKKDKTGGELNRESYCSRMRMMKRRKEAIEIEMKALINEYILTNATCHVGDYVCKIIPAYISQRKSGPVKVRQQKEYGLVYNVSVTEDGDFSYWIRALTPNGKKSCVTQLYYSDRDGTILKVLNELPTK